MTAGNPARTYSSITRFWLPVVLLLALHAALGLHVACRLTTTHDEYWHLPAGLLNLETGRFHFDNLNPPLCRMMAALPLLFTSARTGPTDAAHDPMGWGDVFLAENAERYGLYFVLGRSMIVLLSVLGGLATACWARELFGDRAGCLAALLWAFEPNLIAHGSLVTTDMGASAFFVFTLYAVWRFAANPTWSGAILFGVVLGLAQLIKFTSLILYPLSVAGFFIAAAARQREQRPTQKQLSPPKQAASPTNRRRIRVAGQWCAAIGISFAVLNAGYLFRGSFSTLKSYDFQSAALRGIAQRHPALDRIPVPLPRDYVEGLDHQRQMMEQKHPVFLDGSWSEDGFSHYYVWALFYKLPHALQLLVLVTLLWLVVPGTSMADARRGEPAKIAVPPRRPTLQVFLLLPAVAMLGVAEGSAMQLGLRYVLPAVPFLILFASQSAQWLDFKTYPYRTAVGAGLAIGMLFSVRFLPDHLAYFNELAGGPVGGREHLLDSNLDWGQDLGGLKRYLDGKKLGPIGLAYFGTVPPAALGIEYQLPPSRVPSPGRYAVSVNLEQGRPYSVRTPEGTFQSINIGAFAYFGFFTPTARIGYSIDVFDLTERDIADWQSALRQAGSQP